jgi:PAS domain S-box-containing protein
MAILIGLLISIVLQLIAAIASLRLIKVAKGRVSWILISVAFFLMAVRRFFEWQQLYELEDYSNVALHNNWLGIVISILLSIAVILIGSILNSYNVSEKARLESEERFKTLFNSSNDQIFVADFNDNFIEVNQAACDILGFNKTELMTMSFADIKTSKFIGTLTKNLDIIIKNGYHIFESEHVTKDGLVIPVEINSKVFRFNNSDVILSIARDVSERKELESKILSTIIETEEKERKRFAKDMHDGLGPLLSTIKLYINELSSDELEEEERKDFIKYTNELIDEAVSNTRTISNNLMPTVIEDYGLVKAVDSFCKKLNITQKINISFKTINIEKPLDKTIELIFYRIIIELINNTIKHSGANNINVVLEIISSKLILSYKDDGRGYDLDTVMDDEESGMGIRNIISKVKSLNGNYTFENGDGINIKIKVDIK